MDFSVLFDRFEIFNEIVALQRLTIVLVYAVFAAAVRLFIDRVLRQLASRTKVSFDDELINLLHGPICWSVFGFGVLHALVLGPLDEPWLTVLPAFVKTLLLIIWLVAGIRMFNLMAERSLAAGFAQDKIGRDLFLLLKNVIRVVMIVAGLIWLLAVWKIDLTPLFASAGIAGIAVALAAKDTLANFFGGISIFMDRTFKLGDYIILDTQERGEVVEIGIRSTRIKTRDDVIITIPNSILANSKIINESAPIPRFRIRVPVGVAYGSDLDKVEKVLLQVAAGNDNVAKDPEARVRLRLFNHSSVDYELLCWVDDPSLKGLETHNLLRAAYNAFAEHDIVIPFPQRDVHIIGTGSLRDPKPEEN